MKWPMFGFYFVAIDKQSWWNDHWSLIIDWLLIIVVFRVCCLFLEEFHQEVFVVWHENNTVLFILDWLTDWLTLPVKSKCYGIIWWVGPSTSWSIRILHHTTRPVHQISNHRQQQQHATRNNNFFSKIVKNHFIHHPSSINHQQTSYNINIIHHQEHSLASGG